MILTFPLPVSNNDRLIIMGGKRRMINSAKYRNWKTAALWELKTQPKTCYVNGERLSLHLTAHFPDCRRRDLDNYVKGAQDLLTDAGVWGDDKQVDYLVVERGEPDKQAYMTAEISVIGANDAN